MNVEVKDVLWTNDVKYGKLASEVEQDIMYLELNKEIGNEIVCLSDVTMFGKRRCGCRLIGMNLSGMVDMKYGDSYTVFKDRHNLRAIGVYNGEVSHYTFRKLKANISEKALYSFRKKVESGKATANDIGNYTISLLSEVREVVKV